MCLTILIIALHTLCMGIFDSLWVSFVEVEALFVVFLASSVDFCSCALVVRAVSVLTTWGWYLGITGSALPFGCCLLALMGASTDSGFGNSEKT